MADDREDAPSAPTAPDHTGPRTRSTRTLRTAAAGVLVLALLATASTLWFGHREAEHGRADRAAFLDAARKTVLDLTTISTEHVDDDAARIMDGATGPFAEDFKTRTSTFTSVVRQAHVSTVGTITEAGIESLGADEAKVLVAASSKVTNDAGAQQQPRIWRLRLTMQRVEGRILASNVDFVP
ncbi:Mce associated membrane protein [Nocardia callitridis]|uniref:Mce associated membrane protein n=2 Tax=Nocardia callitridis TaxID=648753 RepID=A0ABP9KCQ5_9NOCA